MLREFLKRCEDIEPACILLSRRSNTHYLPFMHQQYLYWKYLTVPQIRLFLCDEIGLGKTIEACLLIKCLIKRGEKKILILVPKVLRKQWYRELQNFFPDYNIRVLEKGENIRLELSEGELRDFRIFLVSIDLAKRNEYRDYFRGNWDVLVVDEAHNLGSDSLRDELVREIKAKHVIFLSATPHRGNDKKFIRTVSHIVQEEIESIEKIREKDVILRRTKRLVDNVRKELGYSQIFRNCKICAVVTKATENEKKFSSDIINFLRYILKSYYKEDSAIGLLAAVMRKRASSSPRAARETLKTIIFGTQSKKVDENIMKIILEGSIEEMSGALEDCDVEEVDDALKAYLSSVASKLAPAEKKRLDSFFKLLEEIEKRDSKLEVLKKILKYHENEKVIVFTEYRDTLEYLREKLTEFSPLCIYGGMSEKELYNIIKNFSESGRVLIATDVASEGLNLQFARVLVNYEPPWSPIKLEQRIGRIWRLGQKSDVIVYNIFLGTVSDIEVLEKLYGKVLKITTVLGDVKNILGEEVRGIDIKSIQDIVVPGVNFSEWDAVLNQILGNLDEFIKNILDMIERVREATSFVYREENVKNVASVYENLGIVGAERAYEAYEKLMEFSKKFYGDTIIVPREKTSVEVYVVGIASVDFQDMKIEIPIIIGKSEFFVGSSILTVLRNVLENGLVPDEVCIFPDEFNLSSPSIYEPDEVTKNLSVSEFISRLRKPEIKNIHFEKYLRIIYVPSGAFETSREYAKSVGQIAEDIVKNMENCRKRCVEERKTLGKYDFYSFDSRESEKPEGSRESERYIEVKGHGLGGLGVALEDVEYEFAKKMRDKYWLYIVWNVYKPPHIVACFKDPLSKDFFKVEEKEVECVVLKRKYFISAVKKE